MSGRSGGSSSGGGLGGGLSRLGGSGFWALAAGYLFAYFNAKSIEERKARIERVNKQLKNFYGPLLATITASRSAFRAMVRQHSPDGTKEAFQAAVFAAPDGPEARAYRVWMAEVLQPLNERAAKVVTEHIDLLDAPGLEPALLQLVAATSAYRVILQSWKNGDFSAYSVIKYPDHLADSLTKEFNKIKRRQAALLGEGSRGAKAAHIHPLPPPPPSAVHPPQQQQPQQQQQQQQQQQGPGQGATAVSDPPAAAAGPLAAGPAASGAAAAPGAAGAARRAEAEAEAGRSGPPAGRAAAAAAAVPGAGGGAAPGAWPAGSAAAGVAAGGGRAGGGGGGGGGGVEAVAAMASELGYQLQPRSQLRSRL